MKINPFIIAIVALACVSCRTKGQQVNLLSNGDFNSDSSWECGHGVKISDGEAHATLEIPKYHIQWCQFLTQRVRVNPGKDYILTAMAKSSLPALKSSVYVGVRHDDGSVLKDIEYLLFQKDMTPLKVEFNSGTDTSVVVFCGSWANQTVEFTFDDFCLAEMK